MASSSGRHADNRHDDPQRVEQRNILDEVALAAHRFHLVDIGFGDCLDIRRQPVDRSRLEPVPGDIAQLAVLGVIHVDKGFEPVASAKLLQQGLFKIPADQHGAGIIEKSRVVLADVLYILVPGNSPEGFEIRVLNQAYRVLLTQVAEQGMHGDFVTHYFRVQQFLVAAHGDSL